MTQEQIKEVIALHQDWLNDKVEGVRANLREADLREANLRGANLSEANLREANLREADLSRADLSEANLRGANLSEANLRGANLRGANLREANLREANLRGADLSGADLSGADLRGTDLRGVNLKGAKGDGKYIKSIRTEVYPITYTASVLQIGCKNHLISEWIGFEDKEISQMDRGALEWWKKWKNTIMQTIEGDPCEPTRG